MALIGVPIHCNSPSASNVRPHVLYCTVLYNRFRKQTYPRESRERSGMLQQGYLHNPSTRLDLLLKK